MEVSSLLLSVYCSSPSFTYRGKKIRLVYCGDYQLDVKGLLQGNDGGSTYSGCLGKGMMS